MVKSSLGPIWHINHHMVYIFFLSGVLWRLIHIRVVWWRLIPCSDRSQSLPGRCDTKTHCVKVCVCKVVYDVPDDLETDFIWGGGNISYFTSFVGVCWKLWIFWKITWLSPSPFLQIYLQRKIQTTIYIRKAHTQKPPAMEIVCLQLFAILHFIFIK